MLPTIVVSEHKLTLKHKHEDLLVPFRIGTVNQKYPILSSAYISPHSMERIR